MLPMRKFRHLIVVASLFVILLCAGLVHNAQADTFSATDPNTWATAVLISTSGGSGTYTQTWELQWSTDPGAAAALANVAIVGFEWQPSSPVVTTGSDSGPANWTYLATGGGFIGDFANGTGHNNADATSFGYGLDYQSNPLGSYTYTFTTTGALNDVNYHIQFAYLNPSNGKYIWNQNSLSVPEPSSLFLLGLGFIGLWLWRWRSTRSQNI